MKIVTLQKNYTRDTTLVLQGIWLSTMVPSTQNILQVKLPFKLVGVDYMSEGAIEVWENAEAIQIIKESIVDLYRKNPRALANNLQQYNRELVSLQLIWEKKVLSTKKELISFIDLITRLMFSNLLLSYIAEDTRITGEVKEIATKLRAEDHFFATNDQILRASIVKLYPSIALYPTCVLLSEVVQDKIPSSAECQRRFHHFVADSERYSRVETIEEYAKKKKVVLLTEEIKTKELKGIVACPGKVKGKVKILRLNRDVDQVQEGDILVTPMTTPSFLPALRKAAAFVTDEGGVVCHAAIISRELHKPCIISTKVATKMLKEGDIVEVDADKGIVKKVK